VWSWSIPEALPEQLPFDLRRAHGILGVGAVLDLTVQVTSVGRPMADLVTGAGFTVDSAPMASPDGVVRTRVVRDRTLADTVGPDMRLLVCGVNPSIYSADVGVGFGRPGNRFWPAARAAGIVVADRDPAAALERGIGMTDFVKRATRTAAEVTRTEYEAGFARVVGVTEWLRPRAVCFVGLSGWRTVVDRHAVAGRQPGSVGGRPVYLMPSTSGLNARMPLVELIEHLAAAWDLATSSD